MSEPTADATATDAEAADQQQEPQKPTETVEFWKQKAREQESRAKSNAAAAKKLADIEEASKSEAEKTAERLAKADAEVASVPAKVADALRGHLVALHEIADEDAELFLTANEPELLIKQVARLVGQSSKKNRIPSPRGDGNNSQPTDDMREFTQQLFGGAQ